MNAAREYTAAVGDRLSSALVSKSLELVNLQIVPGEKGKFVIRGVVSRPIALQDKVFAVEVNGKLEDLDVKNVDSFVDFILPKIIDQFYGEAVGRLMI